jgi:hypothetical protein
MIKLIYTVEPKEAPAEKEWLRSLKVYPTFENYTDWIQNKLYVRFGMIVAPDVALMIKLRHPLQFQSEYKQR